MHHNIISHKTNFFHEVEIADDGTRLLLCRLLYNSICRVMSIFPSPSLYTRVSAHAGRKNLRDVPAPICIDSRIYTWVLPVAIRYLPKRALCVFTLKMRSEKGMLGNPRVFEGGIFAEGFIFGLGEACCEIILYVEL